MARKSTRQRSGQSIRPTTRTRLVFLVLSACLTVGCGRERVIGTHERIHHDDFEYTVTGWSVTDSIGQGAVPLRAHGVFYVVSFQVENRARRVVHEWDNSIAFLADEDGQTYENNPEAQNALRRTLRVNMADHHRTPAGTTESAVFVFDVPRGVRKPCLMVRGDLLMGDLFDCKAFSRTRVKLF